MIIKKSEDLAALYKAALEQPCYDGLSGLFSENLIRMLWPTSDPLHVPTATELARDTYHDPSLAYILRLMEVSCRINLVMNDASDSDFEKLKECGDPDRLPMVYWASPLWDNPEPLDFSEYEWVDILGSRVEDPDPEKVRPVGALPLSYRRTSYRSREAFECDVRKTFMMSLSLPGILYQEEGHGDHLPELATIYHVLKATATGSNFKQDLLLGTDPVLPYITSFTFAFPPMVSDVFYFETDVPDFTVYPNLYRTPRSINPAYLLILYDRWANGSPSEDLYHVPLPLKVGKHVDQLGTIIPTTPMFVLTVPEDKFEYDEKTHPNWGTYLEWKTQLYTPDARDTRLMNKPTEPLEEIKLYYGETHIRNPIVVEAAEAVTKAARKTYLDIFFPGYGKGTPGSGSEGLLTLAAYYNFIPTRAFYVNTMKELLAEAVSVDLCDADGGLHGGFRWGICVRDPDTHEFREPSDLPRNVPIKVVETTVYFSETTTDPPDLLPDYLEDYTTVQEYTEYESGETSNGTFFLYNTSSGDAFTDITPEAPATKGYRSILDNPALTLRINNTIGVNDYRYLHETLLRSSGVIKYSLIPIEEGKDGYTEVTTYERKYKQTKTPSDTTLKPFPYTVTETEKTEITRIFIPELAEGVRSASYLDVEFHADFTKRFGFGLASGMLDLHAGALVDVSCAVLIYNAPDVPILDIERSVTEEWTKSDDRDIHTRCQIKSKIPEITTKVGCFILPSLRGSFTHITDDRLIMRIDLTEVPDIPSIIEAIETGAGGIVHAPPMAWGPSTPADAWLGHIHSGDISDIKNFTQSGRILGAKIVGITGIRSVRVPFKPFPDR